MSDEMTVSEASQAAPAAPASDAAPAKRRSGRPRKKPAAETPAAADASATPAEGAAPEAPAAPVKRRPGRPRKAEAAAAGEPAALDSAESAPAAEKASAPRRPGRPRKKPVEVPASASDQAAEASSSSDASSSNSASSDDQAADGERKTRVRRTRSVKTASAEVVADGVAQNSAESSGSEDATAPQEASAEDVAPGRAARAARTPRKTVHASGAQRSSGSDDAKAKRDEGRNKRDRNDNRNKRNERRNKHKNQNREVAPSIDKETLSEMKVAELRAKAAELEVDVAGLKKAELVDAIFDAVMKAEGFIQVTGILDVLQDGYGFLRTNGYLPSEQDCYVGTSTIRKHGLRKGDILSGTTRPARPNEKYAALQKIDSVNGMPVEESRKRVRFGDLTPVYPDECLKMEHGKQTITSRVIDLVSPIGKGQRGLIVSPPKAGKTTILKDIAASISANNPEVHLICLLVDERPEEVTDMQRSIRGEVVSSTFDMPTENHIQVSELVIERAKRLVEQGEDVVVLLDSLTRLARAYNLAQPASGRILSGGVDSTALYPPKKFLGAARNIEGGGSLTILASALVETGSKMDEVIFEEFKGTGNMELKLDRNLADRRIFPAIDPVASGTRKEDLLLDPQEAPLIWAVRRILANTNNTERAMDMLIKSLKRTDDNVEFLMRTAKKAQHSNGGAQNLDL